MIECHENCIGHEQENEEGILFQIEEGIQDNINILELGLGPSEQFWINKENESLDQKVNN